MGWLEDLEAETTAEPAAQPAPAGANWLAELEGAPTPEPEPEPEPAPEPRRPSWNMFGQRIDYSEADADADPGAFQMGAEALAGTPELIATLGSAMVAEPVSGLAGLYTELSPGEQPGAGAETVRGVQESLMIGPQSRYGEAALGAVAGALEPLGEAISGVESFLGEATLEATGSPEMAALAHAVPTAAAEALGLFFLKKPSEAAQQAKRMVSDKKSRCGND